jgi:hypothetical protein
MEQAWFVSYYDIVVGLDFPVNFKNKPVYSFISQSDE